MRKKNFPAKIGVLLACSSFFGESFPSFSETQPPAQQSASLGTGVLDEMRLALELKVIQDVQQQLEKAGARYQKHIAKKEQAFKKESEELMASQPHLKPELLQQKQGDLQKRYEAFQVQVDALRRKLDELSRKAMEVIEKKKNELLEVVALKRNCDLVHRGPAIAWFRKEKIHDLTGEVLTALNEKLPKMALALPKESEIFEEAPKKPASKTQQPVAFRP